MSKSFCTIIVKTISMKILLLGEFSGVHWTLAEGLRKKGHEVCVVANKGGWRNYRRDVALDRKSSGFLDSCRYLLRLLLLLPTWRGYDVVQIIGPAYFVELKPKRAYQLYKYLRKHNKKVFMAAYGDDYYYVKACVEKHRFRYCDFYTTTSTIDNARNRESIQEWLHSDKKEYNKKIATDCDGIPTCLYEYQVAYAPYFKNKTRYIPLPINTDELSPRQPINDSKVHFFIGIQRERSVLKGTNIMYDALLRLAKEYPERCVVEKAESVPYTIYQELMNRSDVLLDQLYSYTPAMNALLAMAKGIVVVGGGEEEHYQLLGEKELHPLINVAPTEKAVYKALEQLVLYPEQLQRLSEESIRYVETYHHYERVAEKYLSFWENPLQS